MLTPRFYVAAPISRESGAEVALPAATAQHIAVLRLRVGDALALFDGNGGEVVATLLAAGKREARAQIVRHEAIERESPLSITLVQSLATGDKMDLIVQKAVELGVAAIQPIASARATVKLSAERAIARREHWQAVAIAACEQCGRNRVPPIAPLGSFSAWLAMAASARRCILDPQSGHALGTMVHAGAPLAIAVGPEGGFDDEELALAERAGVARVVLGPRVLRTETAGLAALAAVQALGGGFA